MDNKEKTVKLMLDLKSMIDDFTPASVYAFVKDYKVKLSGDEYLDEEAVLECFADDITEFVYDDFETKIAKFNVRLEEFIWNRLNQFLDSLDELETRVDKIREDLSNI